jgi:hypothetical protein
MPSNPSNDPWQLEPAAKEALPDLNQEFERLLLREANQLARGKPITEEHLREAYRRVLDPNVRKTPR